MKRFIEDPSLLISEFDETISIAKQKAFISIGIEFQEKEIEELENL